MGCLLYIFPHPDDESFGPAPAIARQVEAGHDVHLLTLTRGEATTQRLRYGYSREEMGAIRYREMQRVAQALRLTSLTVLDLPDLGLAEMCPCALEEQVRARIEQVRPDVVVTYPVHGISGHPDHLVTHAVVKRVYCRLRQEEAEYARRLAFFTLSPASEDRRPGHLRHSRERDIDAVVTFGAEHRARAEEALACYETYQEVVQAHDPLQVVADGVHFELFQEHHDPRLTDLLDALDDEAWA